VTSDVKLQLFNKIASTFSEVDISQFPCFLSGHFQHKRQHFSAVKQTAAVIGPDGNYRKE